MVSAAMVLVLLLLVMLLNCAAVVLFGVPFGGGGCNADGKNKVMVLQVKS